MNFVTLYANICLVEFANKDDAEDSNSKLSTIVWLTCAA